MEEQKKGKTKAELEEDIKVLKVSSKAALELAKDCKRALEKSEEKLKRCENLVLIAGDIIDGLLEINKQLVENNASLARIASEKRKSDPELPNVARIILGL